MNDAIVHFTIGSCPIVTIFPFFMLYNAHNRMSEEEKENCKIEFGTLCILVPLLYGILFAILYSCCGFIPRKYGSSTYVRFVICGALTSLLMSIFFHYVFNIHVDWFNLDRIEICHVGVFLFYLIMFYTVGQWLRAQLLYGPVKSSSSSSPSSPSSSSYSLSKPNFQPKIGTSVPTQPISTPASLKFDALKAKNK